MVAHLDSEIPRSEDCLRQMFSAAVQAAMPRLCVPPNLPSPPRGRTIVVGAGKASAAMAKAVEENWPWPMTGLVVTRYGHALSCERIEIVEAGHPVPDQAGVSATGRILDLVRGLTPDDLVLALMSGGGSSLLSAPAGNLTLSDKQHVNRSLLKSGATIGEMNCVRRHLSAVKGGQLAIAAAPARVVTLVISDVPGDDPSVIASGPTLPDASSRQDALDILSKYGIKTPSSVDAWLKDTRCETPKPQDPRLATVDCRIIATAQKSLEAAGAVARRFGLTPVILGSAIEGEARDVALVHAGIAKQIVWFGQPANRPCVLISGGETTVTVRGRGRGGRNAEFLMALAVALRDMPDVYALAADTDGIDGTEDNAGAILRPDALLCAERLGLKAEAYLADNDGYTFFEGIDGLIKTGPTLTNVNDFRAVLINAAG